MAVSFPAFPLRLPQRARTFAVLKSLVNTDSALPAAGQLPGQDEAPGQIVINFPCMPDTIELARRANYKNFLAVPAVPDGLHFYDHTEPLSIPLSFTLHGYDEDYCGPHGPLMLLSIAAKLHALMMPIIPQDAGNGMKSGLAIPPDAKPGPNGATEAEIKSNFEQNTFVNNGRLEMIPSYSRYAFPPACALNLMLAQLGGSAGNSNASNDGVRSLGIYCTGFVSDVRVVFKGPWLQGNFKEDGLRNLPSEAEYNFTFVHQPGYTNNILGGGAAIVSTTAANIFQRLYNTQDLTGNGGRLLYAGVDGSGISS